MESLGDQDNKPVAGTLSVMIADEQEIFRQGLAGLVDTLEGFEVVAEVSSFQEAIQQLLLSPVDLLFVDSSLFGMQGAKAILELKEAAPQTQCVIMALTLDDDLLVEAILLGANGYLAKTLPKKNVIETILPLRNGAFALTPVVATHLIRQLVQQLALLQKPILVQVQQAHREIHKQNRVKAPWEERSPSLATRSSISGTHALTHKLTPQEYKVFHLMHLGLSNKQIAGQLHISPYTVGKHVQQILRKLGARNRTQAASFTSIIGDKYEQ
jgi:DNA-binding NarL/FixJ family response regulator